MQEGVEKHATNCPNSSTCAGSLPILVIVITLHVMLGEAKDL
jgi:hypothetical protein